MPGFEVWQSPGGLVWEGSDQEEAFLVALRLRRSGVLLEVAEIFNLSGDLRPRRIACHDRRQAAEKTE